MANPVTHWQLVTTDPEKAERFYTKLFGWKVNADNPLGCRMVTTGGAGGIDGGIWPAPPEANSFVQLHVEVEDVAASVEKATSLGATVIIPPQQLPDGGEMAVVHDVVGVPLALVRRG